MDKDLLSVSMVHSYKARIHVNSGSYSAVLGLVVDLVRGVGLPWGGFVIMAGLVLRPACLCEVACGHFFV